jgi:hypothetical protein
MSNKTIEKKEIAGKPAENRIDKSKKENQVPEKLVKKVKKPMEKPTVSQIDAIERSAVDATKANSSRTVRGSSGLANTGTIISYD